REIISWKYLSHPNILPLVGVSMSVDPLCLCILSEWMPNGNVMQYARSNPEANRLRLLSEVVSGVAYLHELNIVHGDLKGANVLVDDTGTARITDFGLMTMADLSTVLLSVTPISSVGTFRWMSPELLDPESFDSNGSSTRESDCYALGMVIYEVLTGLRPFHRLCGYVPVSAVLRGERPEKPLDAESLGLSHELWGLVELCWSESSSTRPTAGELLDYLSLASRTWVPAPIYPAIWINTEDIADSDSSSSLGISIASSTRDH
ncbi:kinase-like protein, partial [Thelephora ganbajun]